MARRRRITVRECRDPAILPHHDGLIDRNPTPFGGHVPTSIVLERPGWTPALIARWLGYPDAVLYDPCRAAPPLCLYNLRRVELAEAEFATAETYRAV